MLRIPSPVLGKKKKKRTTTTRVPGPVPIAKLMGTMAQDLVQKKERQCKEKKKKDPHKEK